MITSHSDPHNLRLRDHTRHVQEAQAIISGSHSPTSIFHDPDLLTVQHHTGGLHDTGKACLSFKDYIANPQTWKGDPITKAHALASSVIAGLYLHSQGHPAPVVLSAIYAIAGHHTRLPLRSEYERLFITQRVDFLKDQLQSIDLTELGVEITTDLAHLFNKIQPRQIEDFHDLVEDFWDQMPKRDQDALWQFRITAQLAYSCLLEADRAQLIMGDLSRYSAQVAGGSGLTEAAISAYFKAQPDCDINQHRVGACLQIMDELDRHPYEPLYTVSLSTGLGKTGIGAFWAARCLERQPFRKVIVVQPYLSITNQTERVYRAILGEANSGATLMPYHSISERRYHDTELNGADQEAFYLDTWKSGIIITTYDQLLLAMFSPKAKHQIRFHNLFDALIILDEYQTVPVILWGPISQMLDQITKNSTTQVLAMSATLPQYFSNAHPLLPANHPYQAIFKRYEIHLNYKTPMTTSQFCDSLSLDANQRTLIVVNVRRTARQIRDYLLKKYDLPLYFLTTDITAKERMEQIDEIKQGQPCIVVSTQCVEAGVDIDMDVVYSDFAPLDSLIQRAGRLNRHGLRDRSPMYVVHLMRDHGHMPDAEKVYDPIHLIATRETLIGVGSQINEEDLTPLCDDYFQELMNKKSTGDDLIASFLRWEADIDVRKWLRGDRKGRDVEFLVPHDPQIIDDLKTVLAIGNLWERRRALRDLAPRLAEITISRYSSECPDPDAISDMVGNFRVLQSGYYIPRRGLTTDEA